MSINNLHDKLIQGNPEIEKELFEVLTVRFRLILQHKIKDSNDIEDLLQDTMMMIAQKYKKIDFKISFAAWAYKVLENNLLSYYRKEATRKRRQAVLTDDMPETQTINHDPILKIKLLDCFKKMCHANQRYATIISFHYEGYTIDEISKKMEVSINNVYVLLSRSRTMLKNCLEKGDIE